MPLFLTKLSWIGLVLLCSLPVQAAENIDVPEPGDNREALVITPDILTKAQESPHASQVLCFTPPNSPPRRPREAAVSHEASAAPGEEGFFIQRMLGFQRQIPVQLHPLMDSMLSGQCPERAANLHSWFTILTQSPLEITEVSKRQYLQILRIWADAQWQKVLAKLETGDWVWEDLDDFISLAWLGIAQRNLDLEADHSFLVQLIYANQLILIPCEEFPIETLVEIEELFIHQLRTLSVWAGRYAQLAPHEEEAMRGSILAISYSWEKLHNTRVQRYGSESPHLEEFRTTLGTLSRTLCKAL